MLEVSHLSVSYGKHLALDGVSLSVGRGEIVVMLGANGAGKSSCLKALGGMVPHLPGARIEPRRRRPHRTCPPHEIVEAGLALVPEDRGIFPDLSVRENLQLGAFSPARARTRPTTCKRRADAVPAPRRAHGPARAHHERRRAADGGDRPRPDVEPRHPAARRALARACRRWCAASCSRRSARIKELGVGVLLVEQNAAPGPRHRRPRLSPGERPHRRRGRGRATCSDDPAVRRAYLGGDAQRNGQTAAGAQPLRNGQRAARNARAAPASGHGATRLAQRAPRESPGAARPRRAHATGAAAGRQHASATTIRQTIPGSETMFDVDLLINNAGRQGGRRRHLRPAQPA